MKCNKSALSMMIDTPAFDAYRTACEVDRRPHDFIFATTISRHSHGLMSDDQTPGPPWTILKILRWTTNYFQEQGIESARLDAELLLSHIVEFERIHLYTHFDRPLSDDELTAYRALIKRRAAREPTAYLVGKREFWSLEFAVDSRVLIPRPDTETLVRAALERIDDDSTARLVDIGTGTGAVAIAIATERPTLRIAATDKSKDALDVARQNAHSHDVDDRISFFSGDLIEAVPDDWTPLDIIVSNPPYVAEDERSQIEKDVVDYEPEQALFAGPDGLNVIRRLIAQSHKALVPGGDLLFEIGWKQGPAVAELLAESGFEDIEIIADYGDRDRVASARRKH